ncbi:annexin A7-like [Watersipora subatra]|uniref:annexin A7-like n=1 Tax=Watersipora subatra TaxID=2589382 RepID=UPI00355B1149
MTDMGRSSSSSSSSSDSSDDERKRWKKQQKRQKKLAKYGPGYYDNKPKKHGKKHKHGGHGVPGQFAVGTGPAPYGAYPPAPGAYPGQQPGSYPQSGYPPTGGMGYPPTGGYPGSQPGYPPTGGAPPFSAPGQYPPGGQGFPTPDAAGDLGFGGPPAAAPQPGGFSVPPQTGYGAVPGASMTGGVGFDSGVGSYPPQPSAYPQSGYAPPPGPSSYQQPPAQGSYPPPAQSGYQQPPAQGGYQPPPAQGGYQQPPAQGGYQLPPAQGGYQQPPAQGGYQPSASTQGNFQQPAGHGSAPSQATAQLTKDFSKMSTFGTAERFEGTVKPASPFNPEQDCEVLRKAMKGLGTDEQAIIEIVKNRSNVQRQQIKKLFKTMYGKDLIKDLHGELSGDFRETIMALFEATTYYDAWTLNKAMVGLGTKEAPLIEILCTRTNAEIKEIVSCYKQHFRRDLERDIVDDTSGHFKRLLVSCCQANRAELTPQQWNDVFTKGPESVVDRALAKKEAEELYRAGEKKIGTDESAFLKIMALRHFYQLRATFEEYARVSQRDILNSIGREMSGDLESGFKALVMSARNRPEYFADKLYKSMKGAGTNDSTLIRIVVSRSEIDLKQIKKVFFEKYQKTLAKFIEQDTSGDYKKMLVGIVGYDW